MLTILLSICCGLLNGARGNGAKGGKVFTCIAMSLSAYSIFPNVLYAVLCPLPLLCSWWVKGGTGGYMQQVIKKLQFLNLGDRTWRFFEIFVVIIFMLIYLWSGLCINWIMHT